MGIFILVFVAIIMLFLVGPFILKAIHTVLQWWKEALEDFNIIIK